MLLPNQRMFPIVLDPHQTEITHVSGYYGHNEVPYSYLETMAFRFCQTIAQQCQELILPAANCDL